MTGNDASKYYDIIFLLENHCFLYHFQTYKQRPHFLGDEHFSSIDEAVATIPKDRELYVVTAGEHFYEEIVTFDFSLKDEKILTALIDEHIDKNPSINETIQYHWYPLENGGKDPFPRYYIFGYGSSRYAAFENIFKSFTKMKLLTSSRQLLYSAVKQEAASNEAYIAVYRFHDIEIMAVSNGTQLIFSRAHYYADQGKHKDLSQSINYVRQRFKQYTFTVYLGGSFEDIEQLQATLSASHALTVKSFNRNTSYPDIINGVMDIEDDYNFLPLSFKSKRIFYKVITSISFLLFFISVYFLISLIHSINAYQDAKSDYDTLQQRYGEALQAFTGKEERRLDQLEVISQSKRASTNKDLMQLLRQLVPLKSMRLQNFSWNQESGIFSFSLTKDFHSLETFYAFDKELDRFVNTFGQTYPKSKMDKNYDLSQLRVEIKIEQKKSSLKRGLRGMGHD